MARNGGPSLTWDDTATASPSQSRSAFRQNDADGDFSLAGSPPAHEHGLRRRTSVADRLGSIIDVGGVNSLNNFARSWQRAAGFYEVTPARRPSILTQEWEGPDHAQRRTDSNQTARPHTSLLRAALDHDRYRAESVFENDDTSSRADPSDHITNGGSLGPAQYRRLSFLREASIANIEPALSSPYGMNYGSTQGSLVARVNDSSLQHAAQLFTEQQAGSTQPDKEREPLLVKQVADEDGKIVNVVVGQSTLPQTVFNSANVLIGVGILSLPLAFRYSGWIVGLVFFTLSALVTSYTSKLLAKCLDVDNALITFADLAYVSFGSKARFAVSILFTLELLAACVALVILFADSLDALIPGWGVTEFKLVCAVIVVPLSFMPLRFLSFSSVLGILCCLGIVIAVVADGLVKPNTPGSLRSPAKTYWFPEDWRTLPLAFGLLMAPWGGHGVFPNIYRDMRHPYKYSRAVNITYIFTYFLEAAMAIVGYLMFGGHVRDEITANIFLTKGYPEWLSIFIVIAIAIIPLTKIPLNARPIVSTLEIVFGLDARALPSTSSLGGMSSLGRGVLRIAIRILVTVAFVVIAIFVPSFDRVMSLMGSLACFTICIILPCAFHVKIFGKELSRRQKLLDWTLIIVCTVLATIGTVCTFLPKTMLGVEE